MWNPRRIKRKFPVCDGCTIDSIGPMVNVDYAQYPWELAYADLLLTMAANMFVRATKHPDASLRLANELVDMLTYDLPSLIPDIQLSRALINVLKNYTCVRCTQDGIGMIRRCISGLIALRLAILKHVRYIRTTGSSNETNFATMVAKYRSIGDNLSAWGPLNWFVLHHMAMFSPCRSSAGPMFFREAQIALISFVSRFPVTLPCKICREHVVNLLESTPFQKAPAGLMTVSAAALTHLTRCANADAIDTAIVDLAWTLQLRARQKKYGLQDWADLEKRVITTLQQNHP